MNGLNDCLTLERLTTLEQNYSLRHEQKIVGTKVRAGVITSSEFCTEFVIFSSLSPAPDRR